MTRILMGVAEVERLLRRIGALRVERDASSQPYASDRMCGACSMIAKLALAELTSIRRQLEREGES